MTKEFQKRTELEYSNYFQTTKLQQLRQCGIGKCTDTDHWNQTENPDRPTH